MGLRLNKFLKRIFLLGALLFGSLYFFIFANSLEFENSLFSGILSGSDKTYSEIYFNGSGNSFPGIFFWILPTYLGKQETINLSGNYKLCNQKLRGVYYNNARGSRVWPLDEDTLSLLKSQNSSYDNLSLSGGLYLFCSGENRYLVHGQIEYKWRNTKFYLNGGIEINGNSVGNNFSDNFLFISDTGKILTGKIWDSYGGIGILLGTGALDIKYVFIPPVGHPNWVWDKEFTDKGYSINNVVYSGNAYSGFVGSGILDFEFTTGLVCQNYVIQQVGSGLWLNKTGVAVFPPCFIIKDQNNLSFSGKLYTFEFMDPGYAFEIRDFIPQVLIKYSNQRVYFFDSGGNTGYIMIQLPINGYSGELKDVYYSYDQINWNYLDTLPVVDISGSKFLRFYTNHLTYFAAGVSYLYKFLINNGATYTTGLNVVLNIDVPGAVEMRFANQVAGNLYNAQWVPYGTSYNWTLDNFEGEQVVYGQFKNDVGNTNTLGDTIFVDLNPPSVELVYPASGDNVALLDPVYIHFIRSGGDTVSGAGVKLYRYYILHSGNVLYSGETIETGVALSGFWSGKWSWYVEVEDKAGWKAVSNINNFTVELQSDLQISKTGNNILQLGQTGSFELLIYNSGVNSVSGVVVKDIFPTGLQYLGYSTVGNFNVVSFGTAYNSSGNLVLQWTLDSLNPFESGKIIIDYDVISSDLRLVQLNTGIIYSTGIPDIDTGNNISQIPVYINFSIPIYFTGQTPRDGQIYNSNIVPIQMEILTNQLKLFKFFMNGVEHTVFNTGVFLWENFDNRSVFGEYDNGSTALIKDFGPNNFISTGVNLDKNFDGRDVGWVVTNKKGGIGSFFLYQAGSGGDIETGIKLHPRLLILSSGDLNKLGNNFTINFWFYGGSSYYYSCSTAYILSNDLFSLYINQSNNVFLNDSYFCLSNSCRKLYTLIPLTWYMFTLLFDYDNSVYKVYIGDDLILTGSLGTFERPLFNNYLILGGNLDGILGANGYYDELRIFNYALSEDEIKFLYHINLAKVDIDKWYFENYYSYLPDGWYTVSGYVQNYLGVEGVSENRIFAVNGNNKLNISKSSDHNVVIFGDLITFYLDIVNNDNFVGTGISVEDTIPTGLQFISWTSENLSGVNFYSGIVSGGTYLSWSGFNLNIGDTGRIIFTAKINDSFDKSWIVSGNGLSGVALKIWNSEYNIVTYNGGNFVIYQFKNVDDSYDCLKDPLCPGTGDFFVSVFVKPSVIGLLGRQFIISRPGGRKYGNDCSVPDNQYRNRSWYTVYIDEYGKVVVNIGSRVGYNTCNLNNVLVSDISLETGKWYWIGFGRKGDKIFLFINNYKKENNIVLCSNELKDFCVYPNQDGNSSYILTCDRDGNFPASLIIGGNYAAWDRNSCHNDASNLDTLYGEKEPSYIRYDSYFSGYIYGISFYKYFPNFIELEKIKKYGFILTGLIFFSKLDEFSGKYVFDSYVKTGGYSYYLPGISGKYVGQLVGTIISNTGGGIQFVKTDQYSFHTYRGWNIGTGELSGVWIPRDEARVVPDPATSGRDIFGNPLEHYGYYTNGLRNDVVLTSNSGDVTDKNFTLVNYNRLTDMWININFVTGNLRSGSVVTFKLDYGNSGRDTQSKTFLKVILPPGLSGYGNSNWSCENNFCIKNLNDVQGNMNFSGVEYFTAMITTDIDNKILLITGNTDGIYQDVLYDNNRATTSIITTGNWYYYDVKAAMINWFMNNADLWLFKYSSGNWVKTYSSRKENEIIKFTGMGNMGIAKLFHDRRPNSGQQYLVVLKMSGCLAVGYTGIWSDNLSGFDFTDSGKTSLYPKLIWNGLNYLIPGDVLADSTGTFDMIYAPDLTLINYNLTTVGYQTNSLFDFDLNQVTNALEQALIINYIGKVGYTQNNPAGLSVEDFF